MHPDHSWPPTCEPSGGQPAARWPSSAVRTTGRARARRAEGEEKSRRRPCFAAAASGRPASPERSTQARPDDPDRRSLVEPSYSQPPMVSDAGSAPEPGPLRFQEMLDEHERLRVELARLQGQVEALQERIGAQDAADEHHRAELEAARSETAGARAELKEAQVRVEEWRRLVGEARERLTLAERQRERAERERAAVISVLGRRARKQLEEPEPDSD